MWQLPATADTSEIQFQSDSLVCRAAAEAHAVHLGLDPATAADVYVLRTTPTRYVVFNFSRVDTAVIVLLLDEHFAVLRQMIS